MENKILTMMKMVHGMVLGKSEGTVGRGVYKVERYLVCKGETRECA